MDNTKEENISNIEFKEGEFPSEYKLLVEKLKKRFGIMSMENISIGL